MEEYQKRMISFTRDQLEKLDEIRDNLIFENFNLRISDCVNSYPTANRERNHRENVSEINAKQNRDVFGEFIGYDSFHGIIIHFATIVNSAEHNTFYTLGSVIL